MRFALSAIPNSAAVTAVKDGSHRGRIATANSHDGRRPDWGLIGTSIDYRLRLTFSSICPVPGPARAGHALLLSAARRGGAETLLADLTAAITASAEIPNPGEADEIELIRLCVVASRLDQIYHSGGFVIDKTPLLNPQRQIITLREAVEQVPWFVVDQIRDQVLLADSALGPLRACTAHARPGPAFSGSALIGGATRTSSPTTSSSTSSPPTARPPSASTTSTNSQAMCCSTSTTCTASDGWVSTRPATGSCGRSPSTPSSDSSARSSPSISSAWTCVPFWSRIARPANKRSVNAARSSSRQRLL